MNIVVDLQTTQALWPAGRSNQSALDLLAALARHSRPHNLVLVLDGDYRNEVARIRRALTGLLSARQILVWHAPGSSRNERLRDPTAQLIRQAFIAKLKPDVILTLPEFGRHDTRQTALAAVAATWLPMSAMRAEITALADRDPDAAWDRVGASVIASVTSGNADLGRLDLWQGSDADLVRTLAGQKNWNPGELAELARCLALSFPAPGRTPTLFVDVSELSITDSRTGCQRVTRSVLIELLENPPPGFQVEPVEALHRQLGFKHARDLTRRMLGQEANGDAEDRIDVAPGDVFFGLDFHSVMAVDQYEYLKHLSRQGVRIFFFLHDLLPIERPELFAPENESYFRRWLKLISQFDGVIGNSRSTIEAYAKWLKANGDGANKFITMNWVHLGSDIERSVPSSGLPADAEDVLERIASRPSFLMVGTVEPRKGYRQTLDAFSELWRAGNDINLVIVGHHGWKVEQLTADLRAHPEAGSRLFWLDGVSDEYLAKVYAACDCLIAASEAEGFGLPIVEAARHGLPLIARDIPVFVELAGERAMYFNGLRPEDLLEAIKAWLGLFQRGEHPRSSGIQLITWKETASRITEILLRDEQPGDGGMIGLSTKS